MGKIIDRLRRRRAQAAYKAEFERAAKKWGLAGYELRTYGPEPSNAPPEMVKFRRWPGIPDDLPPNTLVSVNEDGTGFVGSRPAGES